VPEPEGEDFKKAVSVLLPYLLSHRTRLASLEDSSDGAEYSASAVRPGDCILIKPYSPFTDLFLMHNISAIQWL